MSDLIVMEEVYEWTLIDQMIDCFRDSIKDTAIGLPGQMPRPLHSAVIHFLVYQAFWNQRGTWLMEHIPVGEFRSIIDGIKVDDRPGDPGFAVHVPLPRDVAILYKLTWGGAA